MKNRIKNFFPSLPIFLTSLTFFAASFATAQIPSSGLVGYWNFSGNVNDASSNGNNGIMQPGNNGSINFVTDRFGNSNSAIEFTSNPTFSSLGPYIEIPNSQNLLVNSDFTMSYSIKVSVQNVIGEIINKGADAIANSYFSRVANGILQNSIPTSGIINVSNFPIGSWQTVTITYSNSLLSYYLNGVFQQSVASGPIQSSSSKYYFGSMVSGSSNGSYYPFQGIMDDISIYNRALTPAEITQIYASQTSTVQAPCPTLATNLQTGLVGYWPFCGNANDESGNGNNGTVNGATLTTDRFGNANSAYSFDGVNTSISVSDNISLDILNEISISCWFKKNNFNNKYEYLIGKEGAYNGNQCNYKMQFAANDNNLSFSTDPRGISACNNLNNCLPVLNTVDWFHVVGVSRNDSMFFYLNGNQVWSSLSLSSQTLVTNNLPLMFGKAPFSDPNQPSDPFLHYDGKIDDISIYNRALTPAEITQLYTDQTSLVEVPCTPFLGEDQTVCAGTSVTLSASSTSSSVACPALPTNLQTGLVGYWPFCGNANDASSNGNNGTVNGSTLTTDRFGNANSAYSFDGNDWIEIPNSNTTQDIQSITICSWIKVNDWFISNGDPYFPILCKSNTVSTQGKYTFVLSPNSAGVHLNTVQGIFPLSPTFQTNQWRFLAISINSVSTSFYLDGVLIQTINSGVNPNPVIENTSILIGKEMPGLIEYCIGNIDDLMIHNRVLSASEIQQLYTLGQSTYLWSTGATTATINVTPTTTTTYTCTVTDANGNVCTDSVTIFVPQIEATDLTICAGETTTLSVSEINSAATPSACPTLPTNLQTGLVGYWPFCGNANDVSGNGNNGTVNGATLTTDRFGNANNSYSFNGNGNHIEIPNSPSLNPSQISFSFWGFFNTGNCGVLDKVDQSTPENYSYSLIHNFLNENGFFTGWNTTGQCNWPVLTGYTFGPNAILNNLTWKHVAVTIDSNGLCKQYIDGQLTHTYTGLPLNTCSSPNSKLFIGRQWLGDPCWMNGKLDDLSIYNRALSLSEIQQLYTLGQTIYLWSNGATTPTINVSPTSTTTYTCTITTNGVSCTDSVTVVVSNPVIDLGADVTVCGTSTTLTAPSGYDSYLWSNGGTTNTTTVTANGTYSCTVTQGGCSATDSIDVTLIDASITASDSIICAGEIVTLSVPQGGSSNTACAALPTNLQTGLVGYWPFCGNANDASGNGNNGTVNGATFTSDRFGNAGNALAFFDQYDRVVLNNVSLNSVSNYTVSIWYNKVPGSGGGSLYCSSNVYSTDGLRMGLDGNNLAAFGAEYLAGSVWSYSNQNATVNSQWHLFTAVLESTPGQVITSNNLKIYIDGNYQSTYQMAWGNPSAVYSPVSNNGLLSLIGNETWGSQDSFKGLLDDVAIYNRAITASEIQQLYTLGPTTYLWSNGATTPTINVTPTTTTTYTCTVTNNGVSCTDSVTVVVSNPVIDLGADFTVCGTTTTLTAPSGYDSYLWSNGGTTSTTTVTANGTYSCTVTQGGCSASDSINVTLNDATITASDTTICAGETVTLSVSQLTSLPVPNALIGFNGPFVFQGHTYFASTTNVTWSEANLISQSTGGYLAIPNSLDENIFLAQNIFTPTTTQYIGVSDAAIEGLFQDVQGNNLLFSNWAPNEPNNYMNNNEDYVEMYSWGGWNDLPGGSLSMLWPFVIEFNNANPSNQILWSNGATTPTINVSPTSTTTYTCTVTTNGVSCTDSVTVVVSNPVIDLGADVTVCGTSTTLTAPSGYDSYLWSNGGTTNTTTVSANGSYSCTVTQGGCSATDAVDVTLVNATISASDSTICAGQTITLSVPQGGSSSAACAALPTNLQTGLVGYWPFCGNANDASGNGNNGTVNGATLTTDRFGNANSAYSFDGVDDFISMLPTADYPECTVSLYYKLNSINDVNGIGALFSSNWYKFMHIQVGSQGGLNHGVAAYPNSSISCVVGEFIPDNQQWRNVIVTYDGDFLKFYSNGVLVGQNNCGQGFPIQSSLTNYVGRGFVDLRFFKGKIDEVILLNRNISPSEIQQLFTLGQTTYLWSNGATTPTINVSPTSTTTYTCTVTTNGVSCTDDITVVVSQPVASITPNGIVEICQGQSIALTANGGTSYLWNTGAPTQSITVNTEGLYTVTATDANGCTDTESQFVKVNFLPNIGVNNASICSGQSTTLTATGGLSYVWSPATGLSSTTGTTVTASPSTSTVYTVTGTGANGCTNTATAAVAVNAAPTATITPATTTAFCQGGSVVLNANTGTGLTYQWFNNAAAISGATSSSYTANASGSYTVVVTNTSTCSATSTATVVTVNALPTATITPATATTFCQGGSVVLNANTGTGLSYQWRLNGTNITGATSSSYTANASGSYTVVVTNTSACSATSIATVVTVNALPTATITPATATTFCQGGSVVLNANTGTGLSYQWRLNGTNITGATSSSYTANASGSYTVVVTNTSTCSATSTATVVTVNALPAATITAATATTFCQGGSVVLNSNTGAGLTYQWRLNGTNITGATTSSYTANASGSYTVVVTNTSTCSATSAATVVTVNALPTATITPATATTFCQGGSVLLNANTGTGLSYQWFNNASAISGATSSSYTANASGSYTVVVTNTSTCSATSTATVVTVNALPTATITPATVTTFCQGGSVVLNANTGTGLSYQWFNNAGAISGATTSSYTANASGSYTVVVTNTSTCSATSTATVVTVNTIPTATITASSATTFCQGGSVVLSANTGTGLSYQWRLNGTNITGATSSSYNANASGSYTVVVTNTSTCAATSTATVVTVNALPTATITASSATTFCQGGSVVLTANTGTGLSYQWFNNAVAISGATTSSYTANASGSYTVIVTNTSTCSATSTATVVTVNALPTATITPATATTFCQGGSVVLNANTGMGLTYQWRLNGTNITGATSSSYTANASGSYTVVVTNTSTCSATSTATVVTVNALPTATITPATATTFCQGGSVVLNANTGTGLSYQWRLNGTNITGATSSSYTANASGSYTVVVTNTSPCSATSTAINVTAVPNVDYFADADGDGFGDLATLISTCVQPQGYVTDNTDCDDTSADVNPAAAEVCNHIDDDCSGTIDDGLVFDTYYADVDGDTFGDANNSIYECSQPSGYVTNNTDCNDNNANQNTASTEICNGEDDDCDGAIDNGLIFLDYYADLDSDGFGAGTATNSCVDLGAGYVTNNTDCNDNNANQNTASTEICNGEDDDCDGTIDNGITFLDYYADTDGDGFGSGDVISSCSDLGAGYSTNNTDCDDSNSNTNPSATESCNTIDDNCDGQIDEGVQTVYFIDNDGDTYGNPSVSILACTQPVGYTPDDNDCNDTDANINPGAEDIGGNGIDENCDGEIDNSIFELNATISLYPNPTRSELNIQVNSSIIGNDLYIFDAVGKLVFKQQVLSTQTILPVSNFADGNYVVRVGEVVKRFAVEK